MIVELWKTGESKIVIIELIDFTMEKDKWLKTDETFSTDDKENKEFQSFREAIAYLKDYFKSVYEISPKCARNKTGAMARFPNRYFKCNK